MTDGFDIDGGGVSTATMTCESPECDTSPTAEVAAFQNPDLKPRRGVPVYFDLETIPDYCRAELFGLAPVPEVRETPIPMLPNPEAFLSGSVDGIRAALKGIVATDAWFDNVAAMEVGGKNRKGALDEIDKAKKAISAAIEAFANRRKLLSTTPEFCKIVAVAIAIGNDPVWKAVDGLDGMNEKSMLQTLWDCIQICRPVVGYNIISFDLPVLRVRSLILDVKGCPIDDRPWKDVRDVYLTRYPKGNMDPNRPGKLKSLAKVYGIEIPAGDVEGSQVEQLYATDKAKLRDYCGSDVEITRTIDRKFRGLFY